MPQLEAGEESCATDEAPSDIHAAGSAPGINIAPGSDDDGWVVPPPVKLDDGTHLQLYKDGEALHAAYEAIARAHRRICLEVYIFAGDITGQRFAELLAKKAKDGLDVRVIYDDIGSLATDRKMFLMMRNAGVKLRVFHPVRPWETHFGWRPWNRDHRKLLVIDEHFGGLGGLNVGSEYAGSWVGNNIMASLRKRSRQQKVAEFWRDNAVGLAGPAARVLQKTFNRTWRYVGNGGPIARTLALHPEPPEGNPRKFSIPTEGNHFSLLGSSPTLRSPLRRSLHALFASAEESLRMTMAYFAPDDDLIEALCKAARRGVKVQLMLPGKCDVPILVTAARSFYETLFAAGVEIYERQAVVLHAKTMVIDDRISVIGSTNLDYRSIEYNLELSAVITSSEFGKQMATLFENDVGYATKIDPTKWRHRGVRDRVTQWMVSRARYLL